MLIPVLNISLLLLLPNCPAVRFSKRYPVKNPGTIKVLRTKDCDKPIKNTGRFT